MSTDDLISIGKISATHGIRGDVKIATSSTYFSETKTPFELKLKTVSGYKNVEAVKSVLHKKGRYDTWLVHFGGYDTLTSVEPLTGSTVWIKTTSLPPTSGDEFYIYELRGLEAVSEGQKTGFTVTEVIDNPAHTILQFENGENSVLVPFIGKYIGRVDKQAGEVEVFFWEDWFEV